MLNRIEIGLTIYVLIPGGAENLLKISNANGNMAHNGIFLEFYLRRNLFYACLVSIPVIGWYFGYILFSLLLTLSSLLFLLLSIHRYYFIFEK